MALPLWLGAGMFEVAGKLIDRWFPDPEQADKAKRDLEELHQKGELQELAAATQLANAQIEVNKEEAKSKHLWVAGWRPAIGWVCACSLAVYFIPRFVIGMVVWAKVAWASSVLPPLPEMGVADILGLVGTLLGSSLIRMREKEKGVARESL